MAYACILVMWHMHVIVSVLAWHAAIVVELGALLDVFTFLRSKQQIIEGVQCKTCCVSVAPQHESRCAYMHRGTLSNKLLARNTAFLRLLVGMGTWVQTFVGMDKTSSR